MQGGIPSSPSTKHPCATQLPILMCPVQEQDPACASLQHHGLP